MTGRGSSAIAMWGIETGNKAIVFSNARGDEITCMVFDETGNQTIVFSSVYVCVCVFTPGGDRM